METTALTLSGVVSQFLDEGAELIGRLSDDNKETHDATTCTLANWLGRFQIEAGKAMRSEKRKGKA